MKQTYLVTFTGDNVPENYSSFESWYNSIGSSDVTVNQVENFPESAIKEIAA